MAGRRLPRERPGDARAASGRPGTEGSVREGREDAGGGSFGIREGSGENRCAGGTRCFGRGGLSGGTRRFTGGSADISGILGLRPGRGGRRGRRRTPAGLPGCGGAFAHRFGDQRLPKLQSQSHPGEHRSRIRSGGLPAHGDYPGTRGFGRRGGFTPAALRR